MGDGELINLLTQLRPKGDPMTKSLEHVPEEIRGAYEIHEWNHALAILQGDFPEEWQDLVYVLQNFRLPRSSILAPGGRKSPIAISVNGMFSEDLGWKERSFDITIVVDGEEHRAPTHNVDFFKNRVAIEMEWNNKDPFFDRDLNTFRLLHQLDIISVGVIITRSTELQEIFKQLGKGAKYGTSTTHMDKLLPRAEGGGAGGCPVLAFGITKELYDPNA